MFFLLEEGDKNIRSHTNKYSSRRTILGGDFNVEFSNKWTAPFNMLGS